MGRIIAIANQKGGVGKTTTTINLSACLAEAGKKVLTIDMDPQGNTTSGLGVDKNECENTVYELILGECSFQESLVHTEFEGLDLIPSNVNLAGAEIELLNIENREYVLHNEIEFHYHRLPSFLKYAYCQCYDNCHNRFGPDSV